MVQSMEDGGFYSNGRSVCISEACEARINLLAENGTQTVLKEKLLLHSGQGVAGSTFID